MLESTRQAINDATARIRAAQARAETLLREGKTITDPEVTAEIDSAEGATRERDAAERLGAIQDADVERRELENRIDPVATSPRRAAQREALNDPRYREALTEWARAGGGRRFQVSQETLDAIDAGRERDALTTLSDSGGGYLVSPDTAGPLLARAPGYSAVIPLCYTFPTGKDMVIRRRVRRHGTYGSIYTSEFVGSWTGEIPSATAGQNEPSFGKVEMPIRKYRAMARISVDEADDADFDVVEFLSQDGPRNSMLALEYAVLVGSGIGNEPRGVFNMPSATATPTEEQILAVDIEGTTANTISNTTTDLGTANKMEDLHYSLPAQYANSPSARYVMNRQTMKKLRKLVDAQNRFIWVPGFAGDPDNLFAKTIAFSDWAPDDGTDTNKPILWGDLSAIYVPIRRGVSVTVANERYVDTDEIGFFLHQRAGVGVVNADALRFGQV